MARRGTYIISSANILRDLTNTQNDLSNTLFDYLLTSESIYKAMKRDVWQVLQPQDLVLSNIITVNKTKQFAMVIMILYVSRHCSSRKGVYLSIMFVNKIFALYPVLLQVKKTFKKLYSIRIHATLLFAILLFLNQKRYSSIVSGHAYIK